jgi:hypothetical protein
MKHSKRIYPFKMARCFLCIQRPTQCKMCSDHDEEFDVQYYEEEDDPPIFSQDDSFCYKPPTWNFPHWVSSLSYMVPHPPFIFTPEDFPAHVEETVPVSVEPPLDNVIFSQSPLSATPVEQVPLSSSSSPLSATPVEQVFISSSPSPLSATPVEQVPLSSSSSPLSATPVEQVPHSSSSSSPLSATPVEQVFISSSSSPLSATPVEQVPLSSSSSPLSATPVEQVPHSSSSSPLSATPFELSLENVIPFQTSLPSTPVKNVGRREEPCIPFGELATPPPSPNHFRRYIDQRRFSQSEEEETLIPLALWQKTPTSPTLTFAGTPTVVSYYLLSESGPPPTATEDVCDFEEEEENEFVFLDPLKMDAGSTPFQRKRKIPACKRSGRSGGFVKIRMITSD